MGPKEKVMPKKTKKKVTKKKAKKSQPKTKIVYRTRRVKPGRFYLHQAKLAIMDAVPIMPTTVISKDKKGRLFAHTQAEKVYAVYREQTKKHGLVINRIEGRTETTTTAIMKYIDKAWNIVEEPCVRYHGTWEITHAASGACEIFHGSGDGCNDIWSVNSAQTVAKKCGLLDYFEVAWPQPTDWLKVIKESVEELPPSELHKALKEIIPPKILSATSIGEELCNYFNSVLSKHKKK